MSKVQSIEDLFGELVELSTTDQRRDFLDRVCGDDGELREQLDKLFQSHQKAGSFLNPTQGETSAMGLERPEHTSTNIGPYKLLQKIGEGGMGAVYMAEQKKPVKRRVALKIIKPGMDTRQVIARFEAERQALAMMDHPNIAKVLEAGTTDEGRPYFVMELVKGIPITEFCDQQKLSPNDRLRLFIDVCSAVQHAHQKGIIHRDLKPSNVLVAKFDDKPTVKVIDFGVAKATNQELTERTMFTQFGQIVGTLEYMSPEQAQLNQLDIDTRSDIYSLGVLLYELLTGETPLDPKRLRSVALDEVLRIIREEEPPRPSVKLRSSQSLAAVAENRHIEPKRLGGLIKGDLDWIVMKALDKDRSRRYDSANRFGEDVQCHLDHKLVEARPPSILYRLAKSYRRNRVTVIASAGFLLLLFLGIASTTKSWLIALQNSRIAQQKECEALWLVDQNRQLVIQQMLVQAFEGDIDEVEAILAQYIELENQLDEWPDVLRASAYWHAGRYEQAEQLLRPWVEQSDSVNIPATAMLSACRIYGGDWDTGLILGNRLRHAIPRKEYADLDQLFLGYGLAFVDTQRSVDYLSDVLDRNPTWLTCQAMLCDSLIHLGNFTDNDEPIILALRKSRALLELIDDNPFALNVCLFAHRMNIERRQARKQGFSELVGPAKDLAERLEAFPEFTLAHAMPAQFFDVIGDEAKAEQLWGEVLVRGGPMSRWATLGRLAWDKTSIELLETCNRLSVADEDLWTLAARAFILADVPGGRDEAMNLFYRLGDHASATISSRYTAIHIPLLLGEKDIAVDYANRWLKELNAGKLVKKDTSSEWAEEELLRIIATDGVQLPDKQDRLTRVLTSHMLGLLAIADGERDSARDHFNAAAAKPWINIDYCWAEAFSRRLADESPYPSQNPNMQSE